MLLIAPERRPSNGHRQGNSRCRVDRIGLSIGSSNRDDARRATHSVISQLHSDTVPALSRAVWLVLAAALSVCACGTDVTVQRTPNYAPRDVTLSVLGVFKNGAMDAGAWNDWAPTVARATGNGACSAAFDDRMATAVPTLFSDLDESTRQDGITDEVLDRVATDALGNAILVLEVYGGVAKVKKPGEAEATPQQPPASPPQAMGRGRRRGATPSAAPREPPPEKLEVSIGVYSIRDRQVVASVQMRADADASADATQELSGKLRETLHGAKCAGWTWQDSKSAK
jgi:hypothetical protein